MTNDQQQLTELKKLLSKKDFIETELALILPTGASGYALDSSDNVVGIKIGSQKKQDQEILNTICQFRSLEQVVFVGNEPCEIPLAIQQLKKLRFLWLSGSIRKLPPELFGLNLPINVESHFPEFLSPSSQMELREGRFEHKNQENLEEYSIRQEQFLRSSISNSFRQEILQLKGMFLKDLRDDLADPPFEIIARGRDAVASYFRELGADALPLNELKVLLVGNGAAGKTSLVRSMFEESFDPDEPQTHGINIRSRNVQTSEGNEAKLNFWDFGGQEIMHATHQFFLSKRSIIHFGS